MRISAILLAGGRGERMRSSTPKQFLPLGGRPLVLQSLEILLNVSKIKEVIVVCPPQFQTIFKNYSVQFAFPGDERQQSVYNGLQKIHPSSDWVCIHDGVRPFITPNLIHTLIDEGTSVGAAGLGMPTKHTIKQAGDDWHVEKTLDRSKLWEIQTPQLLKKKILESGFDYAFSKGISVTDDISLAELIGHPVKLVLGSYENIKITTPEDLKFAEWLINTKCASVTMEPAIAAGKSNQIAFPSKV